jgi:hypothetical protein
VLFVIVNIARFLSKSDPELALRAWGLQLQNFAGASKHVEKGLVGGLGREAAPPGLPLRKMEQRWQDSERHVG